MDHPSGSAPPPSDPGGRLRRPGDRHRRAVRVGFAISAVLHVVALALYPHLQRVPLAQPHPGLLPSLTAPAGGMVVLDIVAVEGPDDPERPRNPVELRAIQGPAVRPGVPDPGEGPGAVLVAPGPSAAERLRPRLEDPRLWSALDRALADLTLEQRLNLELQGRIAEWQDSLALAEEALRRGTDWTTTDGQGRRWGVSEGQLHLGDVTLPLPFAFGTPVGKRDEVNRRAWEWQEITRGAAGGEVRDSWKDRAQAIRERRDRERAQPRPDTVRSRE